MIFDPAPIVAVAAAKKNVTVLSQKAPRGSLRAAERRIPPADREAILRVGRRRSLARHLFASRTR